MSSRDVSPDIWNAINVIKCMKLSSSVKDTSNHLHNWGESDDKINYSIQISKREVVNFFQTFSVDIF